MRRHAHKARKEKRTAMDAEPIKDQAPETEKQAAAAEQTAEQPAEEQKAAEQPAPETKENTVDAAALQASLTAAEKKNEEYLNLLARTQADFDNFRRRNASVSADSYADGQRNVATAMLPVLDNLERALASAAEDSPLKSGIELTLKQMRSAYEKLGVTAIERLGEKFDPNLENAVMQGTSEDGKPGTVCQVLQKGYMMGKNVLRHAMVKVVPD